MKNKCAFTYFLLTPINLIQKLSFNLLNFHPRSVTKTLALKRTQIWCKHILYSLKRFKTDLSTFLQDNKFMSGQQLWVGMQFLFDLY